MKLPRRNFLHLAAGAAALPAVSRIAWAQAYPSRPVRLIVPVGPAGAADIRYLLIDLTNVDYISSAGLGALHNLYKMFTPQQAIEAWEKEKTGEPYKSGYMKVCGASPSVYYVLNIAGFLQNIPIYPDLDQGIRSFDAP